MADQVEALIEAVRVAVRVQSPDARAAWRNLDRALFQMLSPKAGYKSECEPAYCSILMAGACQYVKELSRLRTQFRSEGIEPPEDW